jgi:SAM-dependent methyltransferase
MVDPASAKRFWDRAATRSPARYSSTSSSLIDEAFFLTGDRDVRYLFDEFGIRVGADTIVLELGSGAGRMTRALVDRTGRVIAADVSASMLNVARRADRTVRVDYLELSGDGLIDLPDASVDLVLSTATLTHVSDRRAVDLYLQEAFRVVKPWGKVVMQVRRRSAWGSVFQVVSDLRNLTRGIRSWARPWRGATVSVESLVSLREQVGLLSLLSLDPRYLWVVAEMHGRQV